MTFWIDPRKEGVVKRRLIQTIIISAYAICIGVIAGVVASFCLNQFESEPTFQVFPATITIEVIEWPSTLELGNVSIDFEPPGFIPAP